MRTANSLDSLDTVTSSIQQARASSLQRQTDQWTTASPQLLRINRSNSMRSVEVFSAQSILDNVFLVHNFVSG